jgi:hypothetical protein
MIAAINSVVATGRKMKVSETFIASFRRCAWRSRGYWPPAGAWPCE